MTLITQIQTPNWQMSNATFGEIVTDGDDILQCISNIIFTIEGQVPFDIFFGSKILSYVSKPINKIIPGVTAELYDKIATYEKRVRVDSIVPFVDNNYNVTWQVNMTAISSAKPLVYSLDLINSSKTGGRAYSDGFNSSFS